MNCQDALMLVQRERAEDLKDIADWLQLILDLNVVGKNIKLADEVRLMKECLDNQCRPRDRHRKPWL